MTIFVPPRVAAELREESRRHQAEVMGSLEVGATIEKWDRMLAEIDPRLTLVKARDWVKTGTSLMPGYWHIIRDNSDRSAPPTVMPITGPHGEYAEPTSRIFELLKQNDLQRPGHAREMREREEKIRQAEEKERERETEERQREIYERWIAGNRTFVSMDRSTPWTQNVRGKRPAAKKDK